MESANLHKPVQRLRIAANPSINPQMSGIRTNAAAVMLGISPNTLRSWERRYGFPAPHRSPGGHRQYSLTEIESLRHTLAETHNVSSAISLARERGEGPSSSSRLAAAFGAFDEARVDRLLEESLTLRSVERTVQELLLASVAELAATEGAARPTPEYEFAWRHATGWLSAIKRLTAPATRTDAAMIFDASAPASLDALHSQALELIVRRAGLRTLLLTPAVEPTRLGRALRALMPDAVILSGPHASLDTIGRIVYAVRSVAPQATVFDYRNAIPDTGASTICRLGETPVAARELLLARLDAAAAAPVAELRRPHSVALASEH
jgi:MerR family transcriptional regulator, light-induced transcriptional regulator